MAKRTQLHKVAGALGARRTAAAAPGGDGADLTVPGTLAQLNTEPEKIILKTSLLKTGNERCQLEAERLGAEIEGWERELAAVQARRHSRCRCCSAERGAVLRRTNARHSKRSGTRWATISISCARPLVRVAAWRVALVLTGPGPRAQIALSMTWRRRTAPCSRKCTRAAAGRARVCPTRAEQRGALAVTGGKRWRKSKRRSPGSARSRRASPARSTTLCRRTTRHGRLAAPASAGR
jgi:hypothetical protein